MLNLPRTIRSKSNKKIQIMNHSKRYCHYLVKEQNMEIQKYMNLLKGIKAYVMTTYYITKLVITKKVTANSQILKKEIEQFKDTLMH